MNEMKNNDNHERPEMAARDDPQEYDPEIIQPDGRPVYRLTTEPSQALVIHCGDPRFQNAFREFITRELGFTNYTPIIIGGGAHAFGVQSFLPKNFKILWEQVKFFVKEGGAREVIVINHEDCQWYKKMTGYHLPHRLPEKARDDLRSAAQTIFHDFTGVHVRTFWASLNGDLITFEEVK